MILHFLHFTIQYMDWLHLLFSIEKKGLRTCTDWLTSKLGRYYPLLVEEIGHRLFAILADFGLNKGTQLQVETEINGCFRELFQCVRDRRNIWSSEE